MSDAGTTLLFKFRSGTHGLNEELGRLRGREGYTLCGAHCKKLKACFHPTMGHLSCMFKDFHNSQCSELLSGLGHKIFIIFSLWPQNFLLFVRKFLHYNVLSGLIIRSERVNETIVVHFTSQEHNLLFHCVCLLPPTATLPMYVHIHVHVQLWHYD